MVTAITPEGQSPVAGSNGWAFTEDDAPGVLNISSAVNDPVNNDGSLFLATPTNAAHVVAQVAASGAPNTLSNVSYQTDLEQTGGAASISIQAGAFCTGTSGFTTFVFEPYENPGINTVTVGQWQTWADATNGMWWSTHTFSGGGGQSDVETFSDLMTKYMAACPDAQLVDIGVGMGSSNPGTAGWVDNLQYTTSAGSANWDFEATPNTTPVTNVSAITPLGQPTVAGSDGWAFTEDDAPGVLNINRVVNDPIHNDGAMFLSTPTSAAHVVAQVAVSGAPSTLSGVSYQTFLGTTAGAASISIQVGAFCTGTSGFTTFVFEPYLNPTIQPVVTGQWQTWGDATSGEWWSTHTFTGGGGQADVEPFPALMAKYMAACPNAQLVDIGFGMGSGNAGTSGWADNLQYTTSAGSANWNFEQPTVPDAPLIGTATAGNGAAMVTFTPPANDGGADITSYTVTAVDSTTPANGGETASGTTSPITVPGLTNGDSYTFTVTATNSAGTGAPSAASNAVIPTTVPGAPTIGPATGGNASATVTFTPPANNGGTPISSYTVTAVDSTTAGNGGQTASGTGSPITVTGLTNGDSYTFTVTATNSAGSSLPSAASNAVIPATVPGAPTIGIATAGNGAATVAFTPPANNGGKTISSYTVTANDLTTPANGGQTNTGATSPITVMGLTNGDIYSFTVTATNGVGTGSPSSQSNAVVPSAVPGPPTIGTATRGNASATVTFTAPANNGGLPITSYTVIAADSTTPTNGGQSASGSGSPITVTGLTNGDTYTFTVTAVNGDGPGLASGASNPVVPATVPGAPTATTATRGAESASVAFTAPASTGGSAITSYTVTATDLTHSVNGGETGTGSSSPVLVSGLTDGDTYVFTVTATNSVGTGPASAPSNGVVPATLPGAPLNVVAVPSSASAGVTFSAPASSGGSAVTSYTVTATDATHAGNGGQTASGAASPIVVSGLTNGDTYTFTVKATNAVGTGPASAPSAGVVPHGAGYWLVASDGGIFSFGDAQFYGSTGALSLVKPIVGMSVTPDGKGYIMVASDGGVFTFGDAQYFGSAAGVASSPIVGIALTPDGGGYWMAGTNGQVYAFGDAKNLGPNQPTFLGSNVVGIASNGTGNGYWLVTAAGGVVPEGNAANLGQVSGSLNKPIVGVAATSTGNGYWLLGGDGGIFSFGDAQFHGSTGSLVLNKPVVGLTPTPDGGGYWLVASDGGIFSFGDAQFYGSTGSIKLNKPVVGMAAD
jgi:predicted RNA-binding protein with TRAM domain